MTATFALGGFKVSVATIVTRVEHHGLLSLRHRPSPGGVYAPHSLATARAHCIVLHTGHDGWPDGARGSARGGSRTRGSRTRGHGHGVTNVGSRTQGSQTRGYGRGGRGTRGSRTRGHGHGITNVGSRTRGSQTRGHGCGGRGTRGSWRHDSAPAVIPTALEKAPRPKRNVSSVRLCLRNDVK